MTLSEKKNDEKFLTASQAAELLNVSISTLKKFIHSGKIKALKTPGGHYRVLRKDLLENLYS